MNIDIGQKLNGDTWYSRWNSVALSEPKLPLTVQM